MDRYFLRKNWLDKVICELELGNQKIRTKAALSSTIARLN